MSAPELSVGHSGLMDQVYRHQRHIYDLTRKYYLLGRDRMIGELAPPPGGTVLELGCGTGRNLILAARRYPEAHFYGLDISAEMLVTARAAIAKAGLQDRITLAQADATAFDAEALFARKSFDRVFVSYSLSMIPGWESTIAAGLAATNGSLHIVDFGQQERLPGWFRGLLHRWLAKFHVTPRESLAREASRQAREAGRDCRFTPLYRGYAWLAVIGMQELPLGAPR
ncbi:class I SAM-dependent methyltransferase [Hoeflea sp. 108]|jgi:S-adenosylmethionine-diacylgycerolhomoserine-N-methlytransferase|uniref:class I SAM-dependent methyltransferase n=1 Tax=Hoeflea sp. 108 TaxID=1116369 RepID=UPI000375FF9A|nr:class I SAM-dependent methyltransferase [Hoeflea sp. 108]